MPRLKIILCKYIVWQYYGLALGLIMMLFPEHLCIRIKVVYGMWNSMMGSAYVIGASSEWEGKQELFIEENNLFNCYGM